MLWLIDRYADGNQAEFARQVGISAQAVNDIVRRRFEPSCASVVAILERWPELSARWLLLGGNHPRLRDAGHEERDGVEVAVSRIEDALRELRETYGIGEER